MHVTYTPVQMYAGLAGIDFAGGAADVLECADQISRDLVRTLAIRGGMPSNILDAYMRYQDAMKVYKEFRPCEQKVLSIKDPENFFLKLEK